jgi:hypothetical protein
MKHNGAPSFKRLAATVNAAQLRTESYQGRDHVVMPTVALVGDIVVQGMSSIGREYIPSHVLAAAPGGWAGRPVVNLHPQNGQGTANTPSSWEAECFGQIFNPTFEDNRLRVDCYLDPDKAEHVGPDAVEVLSKARAGEIVEVSVGAWVWLVDEPGVAPNGEAYDQRWEAAVPDHIAVGLQQQGGRGACSAADGCGGPRFFSAAQATKIKEELRMPFTLLAALVKNADPVALAADLGMSNNELASKLSRALRATVPGFLYVADVYPESGTLIYIAMPKDEYEWYRCKYDASGDEATTSLHKRVEPSMTYKPVANSDGSEANDEMIIETAARLSDKKCSCQHAADDQLAPAQGNEETSMSKVAELAGKLIATPAANYTEADRPKLEALSEAQLEAQVGAYARLATSEAAPVTPPVDPNVVTLTKDEHAHLTRLANREAARDKQRRADLIAALSADDQVKALYGEALNSKPTDELEKLAALVLGTDVGDDAAVDMRGAAGVLLVEDPKPVAHDPWKVPAALAGGLGINQKPS